MITTMVVGRVSGGVGLSEFLSVVFSVYSEGEEEIYIYKKIGNISLARSDEIDSLPHVVIVRSR